MWPSAVQAVSNTSNLSHARGLTQGTAAARRKDRALYTYLSLLLRFHRRASGVDVVCAVGPPSCDSQLDIEKPSRWDPCSACASK